METMKMMKRLSMVSAIVAFLGATLVGCSWHSKDDAVVKKLGTVKARAETIEFYTACRLDTVVLGFYTTDTAGKSQYFPLFMSINGNGLPYSKMDIWLSKAQDEMWVLNPDGTVFGYYKLGSDRCITEYGDRLSIQEPIPETFRGETGRAPPKMNSDMATKVLSIQVP